jgi:hypothetical protein
VKKILAGGKAQEQLVRKNKIKGLEKLQVLHFNIYQDLLDCLEEALADNPTEELLPDEEAEEQPLAQQ